MQLLSLISPLPTTVHDFKQSVKAQDDNVRMEFTSDNTEIYHKLLRLRNLTWFILEANSCAPGTYRIHNKLLKHLPEDTLKIHKEILNNIWTSADFPPWWRAATVNFIPKPNKDHLTHPVTDQLHWPAAWARSWNAWLTHTSFGIVNRSQWGLRRHCSTMDHIVSLERYSMMHFLWISMQSISSLTRRWPMRQFGNMVLSKACP